MTTSWIIRNKETREVICETWNPLVVARLNKRKYEAVPILEYLGRLNKEIREGCNAV